jgi:uncharacterized membrane protein YebE (DUF533 family)
MVRVEPLEKALPPDWRRLVRDQPLLSVVAGFVAGVYLGRRHGRQLLSALVSIGIAAAVDGAQKRFGS